jgi:hypothetical protein
MQRFRAALLGALAAAAQIVASDVHGLVAQGTTAAAAATTAGLLAALPYKKNYSSSYPYGNSPQRP